jgi:hypothetical protein
MPPLLPRTTGLAFVPQSVYIYPSTPGEGPRYLLKRQHPTSNTSTPLTSFEQSVNYKLQLTRYTVKMPRAKPSLFLTVPNAFDAHTYSRADLITPPCYIVSCPPPLATPAIRSSTLSPNTSQSESDCELEDDEAEISLKADAAPWTIDQDEALLSVHLQLYNVLITDILCTSRWSCIAIGAF